MICKTKKHLYQDHLFLLLFFVINLIKGHQIFNLRMSDAKMEGWQEMTLGNREAGSNMSFRAFKLLSGAEDEAGA